ncbi:phosphatase PAP2 family protein [Methanopyrus kandleri]|uniref:Membrane-associated phospholipid phosphatase n=2 Tax=Methanopyrus kandleri TaxID=2320 RepID=Q8TYU4_METKA|nr:phosphatase PAP2 family protein [Methanopyrus kandleri]AAM01414.1 Membrane-associated phospholipid phosphatase [Methanopyrus kandleri AV19]HII70661.1 phosphatase PAP2 family protein [Methanopyrus kandleri]
MAEIVVRFDHRVIEKIPRRPHPVFELIGFIFSGWVLFPSSLILMLFDRPLGFQVLEALVLSMVSSEILKVVVGRPRPQREGRTPWGYSFPSTHTARVASLIPVFWKLSSNLGIVVVVVAIIVAISRVLSRAHYPSDVVAGFLLGYVVGWFVIW